MQLKEATVLIIDDDEDVLTAVRLLLRPDVKEIITEKNPDNIAYHLKQKRIDLILLDMNFNSSINTGNEGFYWLTAIQKINREIPVVMITAYADIDLAVRSLKEGAADFMVKPWDNDRIHTTIKNALKDSRPVKPSAEKRHDLIGESAVMKEVFLKIEKIAATDANILLLGENGTGKDGFATIIHRLSKRSAQPLVKVDMGALTDSLFESELFGYKKGAFTDAREDRTGRFAAADKGTLLLDEIGNIQLHQQAKLLTVLQSREVTPLGTYQPVPVDIRLICATNVPLRELANETRFRKDLMYRINTVEIMLPPLRERGEDIILLARHFIRHYATKYLKNIMEVDRLAEEKLMLYPFPGNVRELQYAMERAVIMADKEILSADDIFFSPLESKENLLKETATNLNEMEKVTIQKVIEKHNGNITHAAKELGLTRTALYRRLSKYNL